MASQAGSPRLSFSQPTSPRLTQSEPVTPRRGITVQDVDACFGTFDGTRYDVSGLSPVQALGKISAIGLQNFSLVLEQEDPTMVVAVPRLVEINKRGLVTTNSQMGKKSNTDGFLTWQRSYVTGILPVDMGTNFGRKMELVDGVIVHIGKPRSMTEPPNRSFLSYPVTKYGSSIETLWDATSVPLVIDSFQNVILQVIPEVQEMVYEENCYKVLEEDALSVTLVDTVWGRPFWLFDKIAEVLAEVSGMPRTPNPSPFYNPSYYHEQMKTFR